MQQLFVQALVQTPGAYQGMWGKLCSYWEWGFWVGVAVGIIGAFVSYFFRPRTGA